MNPFSSPEMQGAHLRTTISTSNGLLQNTFKLTDPVLKGPVRDAAKRVANVVLTKSMPLRKLIFGSFEIFMPKMFGKLSV